MNPKFDGPSFVNPNHTSFALDNGKNYQTPKVNISTNKDERNGEFCKKEKEMNKPKGKPRGGWEDDEKLESESQKNKINNVGLSVSKLNGNSPNNLDSVNCDVIRKKIENSHSHSATSLPKVSNHETYVNYWDPETSRKIQNSTMSVEYENKLVDDILLPTGITIKPSDNQINEFLKRLKSLDKKIIGKILVDKISASQKNTHDQILIKTLTKCLYVINAILNEKIEELFQFFYESQEIFDNLQQTFSKTSHKKVVELSQEILSILNRNKATKTKVEVNSNNHSNVSTISYLQFKKLYIDDANSASDKSSSVSGESKENKSKFSFIKKKTNNEPESDKRIELEHATMSDKKSEILGEIFESTNVTTGDIGISSITEKEANTNNTTSKFTFIKSKGTKNSEIPVLVATNNATGPINYKSDNSINKDPLSFLNDELSKAFSFSNHSNNNFNNLNYSNTNLNYNNAPNLNQQNQIIINNPIPYTNPINTNIQSFPTDIDMLFDEKFMQESNLVNMQDNSNNTNNNSNKHFDFVNELLKPNKFR